MERKMEYVRKKRTLVMNGILQLISGDRCVEIVYVVICECVKVLVSTGNFLLTLSAGATAGFSAILIPQLQHGKGHHHRYSIGMVSWIASMSSFALIFGNIISGYLMDRLGRKRSQFLCGLCFVLGWGIIAFSNDVLGLILTGRFITGLCQGWLGPVSPVFVAELSSPDYRGFLLASLSLSIAVGVFLSHLFGTFLRWNIAALLCAIFPLVGTIITYFAPESPVWYASQNRIDDCIKSFQWYRGTSPAMKTELDRMIFEQSKKDRTQSKMQALSKNIKKPEFWKPLAIMMIFFLITQLSGINVICAYTTEMMTELMGRHTDKSIAYAAMLSVDILRCASLVAACVVLRKCGRRPLALFSGIFTTLSLITLAVYLYLVDARVIRHMSRVISLGLMAIYIIVSNLGISPLPWNMVGELFASETKGLGSGISVMMTSVAFFGTIKTAPYMFESIGHNGAYLFYGISTLLGTIFLFFYLPETRGKTLLQIEEYFRKSKKEEIEEKTQINGKSPV
ncbi:facilitated trehalose transporter Tret1-like isoform X2 [Ostrinia furnacalis]|uniref:facilitated trehalose transporter Tret1-like isoform X2 n=1 Tax=Ostrinia furnacalis TaxID=93504 RepID=UPI00103BA39A|nr:facilitated trehalose transporter Tret1-like isoform X2 [Ostrinia furnacalis]